MVDAVPQLYGIHAPNAVTRQPFRMIAGFAAHWNCCSRCSVGIEIVKPRLGSHTHVTVKLSAASGNMSFNRRARGLICSAPPTSASTSRHTGRAIQQRRRYWKSSTVSTILHGGWRQADLRAIGLDLTVAFDTVDHSFLIERLQLEFGVNDTALDWLCSYLVDCMLIRFIKMGQHQSDTVALDVAFISVPSCLRHSARLPRYRSHCDGKVLFSVKHGNNWH